MLLLKQPGRTLSLYLLSKTDFRKQSLQACTECFSFTEAISLFAFVLQKSSVRAVSEYSCLFKTVYLSKKLPIVAKLISPPEREV